jgi:hypothetical protein
MPWWQDTYKYAKLILSLVTKTDRHEADIKALQAEVRRLSDSLQDVIFERQRDRDNAEHARQIAQLEHELLLSRLQTKLLSYERILPPLTRKLDDEDPL